MAAKAVVLLPEGAESRVQDMNALARDVVFERVDPGADLAEIHAACAGAAVLVAPNRPATNDIAAGIEGLKLVQTFSAGTEGLDKARLLNLGIQVANCGGGNAACVAEHAIGLLLMVNHKLDRQAASVRAGRWSRDVTGPLTDFQTLTDKRIGIVGLGNIGSGVARRLKTWGRRNRLSRCRGARRPTTSAKLARAASDGTNSLRRPTSFRCTCRSMLRRGPWCPRPSSGP